MPSQCELFVCYGTLQHLASSASPVAQLLQQGLGILWPQLLVMPAKGGAISGLGRLDFNTCAQAEDSDTKSASFSKC